MLGWAQTSHVTSRQSTPTAEIKHISLEILDELIRAEWLFFPYRIRTATCSDGVTSADLPRHLFVVYSYDDTRERIPAGFQNKLAREIVSLSDLDIWRTIDSRMGC